MAPFGSLAGSFQSLLDQRPTPEQCVVFHLQRIRFKMIVEKILRRRQLTETEIIGRDLRGKTPPPGQGRLLEQTTA